MIQTILTNANKKIQAGDRPLDALKTACNQALAYVTGENNEYEINTLVHGSHPVSVENNLWVTGWI